MTYNIELRDYFAGQALSGLLANNDLQKGFLKDCKREEKYLKETMGYEKECFVSEKMQYHHAMIAYKFADAMLKEKESTQYKELSKAHAFDRNKTTKRDDGE